MELNRTQVDMLQDFADDYDYDLREDYSGRCLYGRSCIGFVTDDSGFTVAMNLCSYLNDMDPDNEDPDVSDILNAFQRTSASEDSMGLSRIIYFPSVSVKEREDA